MVARTIAGHPEAILADEPVSGVDLPTKDRLLRLLREIQVSQKAALAVITHDLSILNPLCGRIVVMYEGRVLEEYPSGPSDMIPEVHHPYTRRLRASSLALRASENGGVFREEGMDSPRLEGSEDTAVQCSQAWDERDRGCRYRGECDLFRSADSPEVCITTEPHLLPGPAGVGHRVACHLVGP
jgi:ABC-type dipeptide/oligopeptide/nickel transport system ATPase component